MIMCTVSITICKIPVLKVSDTVVRPAMKVPFLFSDWRRWMGKSQVNVSKVAGLIVAGGGLVVYWADTRERVSSYVSWSDPQTVLEFLIIFIRTEL